MWDNSQQLFREILVAILAILIVRELPSVLATRPTLGPVTAVLLLAGLLLVTVDGAPRFPPADDLPWTYADVDAAFGQLGQDPVVPTGYDVNQNGVVDFYDVIQIFERSRP